MKAIVLSFDDQLEIANFVVESYNRLWPGCPLTFRIPYTERDPRSLFTARNIEPIPTLRAIRPTIEGLLRGVPDDEFVYWCIDDRYPIFMYDLETIAAIQRSLEDTACEIDAVRITAPFRPERNEHTFVLGDEQTINGVTFRRLCGRNFGFYMPQFVRVSVLRRYFLHSPLSEQYSIREFHRWLLKAPIDYRIYMPDKFLIKLGEATIRGQITEACAAQMKSLGLKVPDVPVTSANRIYG